jgi:predicted house-cleaning noncanonical NTP pyrophosphatase (MazG superfamily)
VTRHDKLVRDLIPDIIRASGRHAVTHTADDGEYAARLKEKLAEELQEYLDAESIEEMADLFEVISAILDLKGWSFDDVYAEQQRKREARGGFAQRLVLEETL